MKVIPFHKRFVDIESIEIEDIDMKDYPDFCDAYLSHAEYANGTPLDETELEEFAEDNYGLPNELIHDNQLYV